MAPEPTADDERRDTVASDRLRRWRTPVAWGVVWGGLQAASPMAFFWLDDAAVYALGLTLIAAVYIGFSVADGRPTVIAVETAVAAVIAVAIVADFHFRW